MKSALIGYSGFVGATLLKQGCFEQLYRSTTIHEIDGHTFDAVVCAGAPAQKWLANREPELDRQNIDTLISHLKTIKCQTFVLISTVDVFGCPIGVDEDTLVDKAGLHAYGLNRRRLEEFVETHFEHHLIVRLPGLVGPGLRKNVIFDFLNNNALNLIDCRGTFQFYPMVNLWFDIQTALAAGLKLVHLTAEPIRVEDVARSGFGKPFDNKLTHPAATYDMQSKHAALFGGSNNYQYTRRETVLAIRAYAQSEPIMVNAATETAS